MYLLIKTSILDKKWLELLMGYGTSISYHLGKDNVDVNALNRLSMGSVTHFEEDKKEIEKDVHRIACLGL